MRGYLCRAVLKHASFYSGKESEEEGRPTLTLFGSDSEVCFSDLVWDEKVDEMASMEDDENTVVLVGVAQAETVGDRPLEGLLLRLTGKENGQYRRVGYFRIDDEPEEDNFEILRCAFNAVNMPTPFYERTVEGRYEFTIV
jgi:hypothetical protein